MHKQFAEYSLYLLFIQNNIEKFYIMRFLGFIVCTSILIFFSSALTAQTNTFPSSGNVGIGTTSPATKLVVVGNDNNGSTATLSIQSSTQTMLLDGNEIDGNTGLYLNNNVNKNVMIATGGGNVGVGTTTPGTKLEVVGAESNGTTTAALTIKSPNQTMMLDGSEIDANTGLHLNRNVNQDVIIATGGGNVGIGTNTPQNKLEVNGSAKFLSGNHGFYFLSGNNKNASLAGMRVNNGSPVLNAKQGGILYLNRDVESDVRIQSNTGGSVVSIASFNKDGNVGIGTDTPSSWFGGKVLEIDGDRPVLKLNSSTGISTITFSDQAINTTTHDGEFHLNHVYDDTTPTRSYFTVAGYPSGHILNVFADGKVGIGTSDPQNALDVCGTVRANEMLVESGWCDYVFEADHEKPSLEEVDQFIQSNGHLPQFESAEAMNEEIKIADVTKRQQLTIEEMMLHLIEMNKELKELKAENSQLRSDLNDLK